jgi:hypothetical protein
MSEMEKRKNGEVEKQISIPFLFSFVSSPFPLVLLTADR